MRAHTFIELIMVLVVVGIIAVLGVPMLTATVDAWSFASRFQNVGVSRAIVAMNRMSREIRRVKSYNSVSIGQATQINFTDINNNAISYSLSGSDLLRNTDALCSNVSLFDINYYDANGVVLSRPLSAGDLSRISRVAVRFDILAGTNTLNFSFAVKLQNSRRIDEKFQ